VHDDQVGHVLVLLIGQLHLLLVGLDEDEEEQPADEPAEEQMEVEETADQANKKQMKLTYEEYKNMSNLIIMHMRQKEETQESGASESASEDIKRSDVINWYLEEISGDIESQEELGEKKAIVEKVVDRLIYQDRVIIPLKQKSGLKTKGMEEDGDEDPYLVVHPNYVIDI
jgi:DNA replication licensing factor MCM6